jgi:hypothetical protein
MNFSDTLIHSTVFFVNWAILFFEFVWYFIINYSYRSHVLLSQRLAFEYGTRYVDNYLWHVHLRSVRVPDDKDIYSSLLAA